MILDASAVVAVLLDEPVASRLVEVIDGAASVGMGAPSVVETAMVLTTLVGPTARTILARFLSEVDADVVPFTELHVREALTAFESFGKGRHPAGLNFGDCMAYAVASLGEAPLLCTGNDFARTDLALVAW